MREHDCFVAGAFVDTDWPRGSICTMGSRNNLSGDIDWTGSTVFECGDTMNPCDWHPSFPFDSRTVECGCAICLDVDLVQNVDDLYARHHHRASHALVRALLIEQSRHNAYS